MRIQPEFFAGGFVADHYRLGSAAREMLLRESNPAFQVRLLMLEAWGSLFFGGSTRAELLGRLYAHTTIAPGAAAGH
jgi:hypothetical protein